MSLIDVLEAMPEPKARQEQIPSSDTTPTASKASANASGSKTTNNDDPEARIEVIEMQRKAPLLDLIQEDTGESGRECGTYTAFHSCPICGHRDDFRYYHETNLWTCFGGSNPNANADGRETGGYLEYLQRARKMTSTEAMKQLREVTNHPYKDRAGRVENAGEASPGGQAPAESVDYDSFFRSYDDIATQKKRREFDWLMPGVVARGLLTLLTASAGVGKTDTLYQMFDAAVSGGQWLAYRFDRKLNALYVDPEMDECGTDGRFYDIREERKTVYSPNPDYRRDIIQYLSLEPQQRAKIDTIAKLIPFLRGSGRRFDLIIIDSIAALMPKDGEGSENDNLFVRNQLESLASFAKDMGAGVVVSHHTGKAVGQGLRNGNAARGASAWKDVPSVVMEMHPLSTRKSKEAQTMIESLSVERWDYVFRRNVRRFPQPIRLLYRKNRYTAHLPQLDMLYRYPLHIVKDDCWDIQAILRDCKIAADPAEAAAREKQERAKERVSDEAKAILAIIDDVHAEGLLATCENVYPCFSDWRDENGYSKELSLDAFRKACTKSGRLPFTKDSKSRELIYTPDEIETEADS